jgi:hypothetical protein
MIVLGSFPVLKPPALSTFSRNAHTYTLCGDKFANQAAMLVKGLEKCIAFVREIVGDT